MNRQPVNNSHGVRIKKLLEDTMDEKSNPQDLVERLAELAKELGISKEQWKSNDLENMAMFLKTAPHKT